MERIEIQLSKKKILFLSIGAAIFVILGILFILYPKDFEGARATSEIIFVVGVVSVLFFGVCLIFAIRQIFNNQAGLIVNAEGVTISLTGNSSELVLWDDIENIAVSRVMNQRFVSLYVKNPDSYIDAQKNLFKRKLAAQNYKMVGTPISISANTLKISSEELYTLLQEKFDHYKQTENQ